MKNGKSKKEKKLNKNLNEEKFRKVSGGVGDVNIKSEVAMTYGG